MSENICIQALITSELRGKYLLWKCFAAHRCNSISTLLCEVNLSTAIFFAFKKFFVVSHFIALWFICILLWVLFFCCCSCDSNLFYCEKSHCEHPSFRANLRESCKNKHCQKHKGPGSWAIKHSAHFCQLLPVVNNLDSLCFCFFQRHNLLHQACTALISSQANDISFRL